jgi:FkbM family methyltransferase
VRLDVIEEIERLGILRTLNSWITYKNNPIFNYVLNNSHESYSQLSQDLVARYIYENSTNRNKNQSAYFVEFGATDGISLSNSYILERDYFWKGIVCEPARIWHENLAVNRKCSIDFRCVDRSTGQIMTFLEVEEAELSVLEAYTIQDQHFSKRSKHNSYEVETVSLNDLLKFHRAPKFIDFMSIDTEGSEYSILESFDFNEWNVGFFAIEHNFTKNEKKIDELLSKNGYKRIFASASKWDGWYVPNTTARLLNLPH